MTNGTASETNGIPSEVTLLTCPFCGGEASVIDHHNDDGSVSVGCADDTCLGFSGLGWLYPSEETAAEAWNRRTAVADYDFAMAVHDGNLWGKCSECKEHQGHYLDAEMIQRQQKRIAELEAENRRQSADLYATAGANDKLEDLAIDLYCQLLNAYDAKELDEFAERMRELGIEVKDEG